MAGTGEETTFAIGDLARRSGVAVTTLRAWERRYGLLQPRRSEGGHRRYDEEDLRRINAVRLLVAQGVTLAAAAARVREGRGDRSAAVTPAGLPPVPGLDPEALEAAYRATRALLHIGSPDEAVDILIGLVTELGGEVVAAVDAGPDALPLDLSLGERPPLLPAAGPSLTARDRLERVLRLVVEDARRAAAVARRLEVHR